MAYGANFVTEGYTSDDSVTTNYRIVFEFNSSSLQIDLHVYSTSEIYSFER